MLKDRAQAPLIKRVELLLSKKQGPPGRVKKKEKCEGPGVYKNFLYTPGLSYHSPFDTLYTAPRLVLRTFPSLRHFHLVTSNEKVSRLVDHVQLSL